MIDLGPTDIPPYCKICNKRHDHKKYLKAKRLKLKKDLGKKLFKLLTKEQEDLIINTAGVLDLGIVDIKDVYKIIQG